MIKCLHQSTETILTPDTRHYGKLICSGCGVFLRWLPKPETLERYERNARLIVALRVLPLTGWNRQFIDSIDGTGPKLSPKQQDHLERIADENGIEL